MKIYRIRSNPRLPSLGNHDSEGIFYIRFFQGAIYSKDTMFYSTTHSLTDSIPDTKPDYNA